ncbi:MAG: two-component sensor histidine kinase [Pseudonocardiaceae bacterium]|nr:two-component sensor histidine kinase [Pseudonocardiaceae bacterium]
MIERANAARARFGTPGIVLLAAVLFDVLAVGLQGGGSGIRLEYLSPLSGILGFAACALWAISRPVAAAVTGALVLAASTALLGLVEGAMAFAPLIAGVSSSQTVAGFELVFFCVLHGAPPRAVGAVILLVGSGVLAVLGAHTTGSAGTDDVLVSLLYGSLVLAVAVIGAVYLRRTRAPRDEPRTADLLGKQWPLIALLSLTFFFEATVVVDREGPVAAPALLLSGLAGLAGVWATRHPVRASMLLAPVLLGSGLLLGALDLASEGGMINGIPPTQVAAGLVVTVFLVRHAKTWTATRQIGLLAVAVAAAVLAGQDGGALRPVALQAALALGSAVAVGLYFRARDSERASTVAAAVREAQTGERMALARELHDVVAHQVTGIVVQAQAAKAVADSKPEVAQVALGRIEAGGLEALAAMRRLVGSMRGQPAGEGAADEATTDFAADLRALVAEWHGVPVSVELELDHELPLEVARSVLRLVQESLTNIGKHAEGASAVRVRAASTGRELHILISDDGKGSAAAPIGGSGGYGIVGMRERVELLGGLFTAGPGSGGGWLVEAWLPIGGAEAKGSGSAEAAGSTGGARAGEAAGTVEENGET